MKTTAIGATTLREWGAGEPLLFLHAMGPVSSGAMIGTAVGPLVEAGRRVIAPDLPGYADSAGLDADDYDVSRLATRMWGVADAAGLDRVVLAGHSWGGAIACHMHAAEPERVSAFVLVDSGHLDYADVLGADELALPLDGWVARAAERRFRVADVAELASQVEVDADDPILDDFLVALARDDDGLVSRVRPEHQGAALYHLARARQSQTWAGIRSAGTPTLVLLATEPESARAQNEAAMPSLQAAVPHADVRLVPNASHSLVTDLRGEFGAIVADWLSALP